MPLRPQWILELPRIRRELDAMAVPVLDRTVIETLFGVRRRRAIQLMHSFGGYQAGKTFLIDRVSLRESIDAMIEGRSFQQESERRRRLVEDLEAARKAIPARQVRIAVQFDAVGLPQGVRLEQGSVRFEFSTIQELLGQLFQFSQALVDDFADLERRLSPDGPGERMDV